MTEHCQGKVALVAGATRGAGRGTAVALGEAGATVYCTGRTTRGRTLRLQPAGNHRGNRRSMVTAAGGAGIAVAVDHLEAAEVEALVQRIDAEHGRLDILVNDIWGGENLIQWNTPLWAHDLDAGLRMLHGAVDTHLITSHFALPLLIRRPGGLVVEMTDGTREYNAAHYRVSVFYDLAKTAVLRLAFSQAEELKAVRLHGGGPDAGLDALGDDAGALRRDRSELARRRPPRSRTSPRSRKARGLSGRAVAALAADPGCMRRTGGSFSSGGLAREYGFTDVDGSQPDCWRYLVEVQEAGLPADASRLPLTALPPVNRCRPAAAQSEIEDTKAP